MERSEKHQRVSVGKAKIPHRPTTRRDLVAAPIVVTAAGVVINGHARLAVAQQLGAVEVPAIVVAHPDFRMRLREEC
jgi:ParB-like chromosome segregation protein Spo0J